MELTMKREEVDERDDVAPVDCPELANIMTLQYTPGAKFIAESYDYWPELRFCNVRNKKGRYPFVMFMKFSCSLCWRSDDSDRWHGDGEYSYKDPSKMADLLLKLLALINGETNQ